MRFILNIIQLLIGITLGLALMVGGSLAAGYYLFTKFSITPERPSFSEEKPKTPVLASPPAVNTPNPPSPSASPAPPSPTPAAGLYKGVINWSEGLILRDSPGNNSNRIGGVGYNQQVIVIEESEDKNWQRVRVVATGGVGWIKAGNMDRIP
ncbi:MAG: SH3 domain-containing protein [Coleofasciculaceae cyanobacterium SM2_1_6]|nr:SH3 domain-containing protein [Coleofasciculaceae cyanobacterium SM2_1_6]